MFYQNKIRIVRRIRPLHARHPSRKCGLRARARVVYLSRQHRRVRRGCATNCHFSINYGEPRLLVTPPFFPRTSTPDHPAPPGGRLNNRRRRECRVVALQVFTVPCRVIGMYRARVPFPVAITHTLGQALPSDRAQRREA
ncbi:hypothetical protein EVAR_11010_1 [Eumeta japonica]|uniref:Uncharacterized protein n=1 Tax=Eumeta variegata TaxID=151549 RepID=A0A4C1YIH1_EUMVA|nr:hypothetical protein EVAR_11010_1 [Eumeta japonica]